MCLLTPVALVRFSLKSGGGTDFGNGSVSWSKRGKPQRFAPHKGSRHLIDAWQFCGGQTQRFAPLWLSVITTTPGRSTLSPIWSKAQFLVTIIRNGARLR